MRGPQAITTLWGVSELMLQVDTDGAEPYVSGSEIFAIICAVVREGLNENFGYRQWWTRACTCLEARAIPER